MIRDGKLIPTDLFGNVLKKGQRIVYIQKTHGYTILSWATISNITWKESRWHQYLPFAINCTKYAQKGGWDDDTGKWPQQVILRNPSALIVGKGIDDYMGPTDTIVEGM